MRGLFYLSIETFDLPDKAIQNPPPASEMGRHFVTVPTLIASNK